MSKLAWVIIVIVVIAVILQMSAGIVNAVKNGSIEVMIGSTKVVVTSEHLWWDSLFCMEGAILLAIIYSISGDKV